MLRVLGIFDRQRPKSNRAKRDVAGVSELTIYRGYNRNNDVSSVQEIGPVRAIALRYKPEASQRHRPRARQIGREKAMAMLKIR